MQGKFTLRSLLLAVGIVTAGVAAACSDQGTLVGPTDAPDAGPSFAIQGSTPACEIITFDDLSSTGLIPDNFIGSTGDQHGYSIPPAYAIDIFDFTVNLTLVRGDADGAANPNPMLFNTGRTDRIWEEDIQYNPVAVSGGSGFAECNDDVNGPRDGATYGFNPTTGGGLGPGGFRDCEASGLVVIVEDDNGIENDGNDSQGGSFTLGPFAAGEFYFQSIDILDNGDLTESPVEIYVDAVKVAESSLWGNGTNEKVVATVTEVIDAGSLMTVLTGSGAIDNIEICRRLGGEGCTPGYWKQPHHFDSWPAPYTPGTMFCSVFAGGPPGPPICAFPGKTLLQVLRQGGGGLKALGRHTVAALLNAASGGVDYDLFPSEVIEKFNTVFPGGDYEDLKDEFEGFNEQGCPLN